ncbi:hypothetical protein NQZ68_032035 [Dissostichus eleginoides]|nr:hypothetical protein NQZ68_032035 [Dissostichus eleginoides]
MVIALLCPFRSFRLEDLASSMIERGLAQKDEQQADSLGMQGPKAAHLREGEAEIHRERHCERVKQRAGEFKEADLTRYAIDLLVWVHSKCLTLELNS